MRWKEPTENQMFLFSLLLSPLLFMPVLLLLLLLIIIILFFFLCVIFPLSASLPPPPQLLLVISTAFPSSRSASSIHVNYLMLSMNQQTSSLETPRRFLTVPVPNRAEKKTFHARANRVESRYETNNPNCCFQSRPRFKQQLSDMNKIS